MLRRTIALCLVLAACGKSERPPAAPSGGHAVLAYLERSACMGSCPAYSVTIYGDGVVDYEGRVWVKLKGKAQSRITPAELAALRGAFAKANFKSFHDYQRMYVTDAPSAEVWFVEGGHKKVVQHYFGDDDAPKALVALEDEIDRIVHVEQFIGAPEERKSWMD